MASISTLRKVFYPEHDGNPIAENTRQFRWIVTIEGGLEALFADDPNVFVAGDLLWYPVEGDNKTRTAPDAMVVFGRPKGDRSSYLQWREENVAPQVVFEILSPSNSGAELIRKFFLYRRRGVCEFYTYDPDNGELMGWRREAGDLEEIESMNGWVSPLLGVRFELVDGELALYRPDGERFATYLELAAQKERAIREAKQARQEATAARRQAQQTALRAERLAERLREPGIEPDPQ